MIAEYWFDYQACLGYFWKFGNHGGGKGLSFVHRLSVFLGNLRLQKISPPAKKKTKLQTLGWTPYPTKRWKLRNEISANFFVTEAGNALAALGNIHEDDIHILK